jgi:RNA polymerase-associated protein CTR9
MIQQKAAEMLIGMQSSKRTLEELQRVVDGAAHAQQYDLFFLYFCYLVIYIMTRLFASLAADKSTMLPYSREMAGQRRKYGDSLKRRGDEQLAIQRDFEADAQAKLDAARQRRQAERDQREAEEVRDRFVPLLAKMIVEDIVAQTARGAPSTGRGAGGGTTQGSGSGTGVVE